MDKITLQDPLDMHLHLREGALLKAILPFSARPFSAALIMPNLTIPITTTKQALDYKVEIESLSAHFKPLVALYLHEKLSSQELEQAKAAGLFLLKLYPKNATTNSDQGIGNILSPHMLKILETAQNLGFILCIHAEDHGFVLDREYNFHPILITLAQEFPRLKIIMEHISDARSIPLLERYPNLYATLTLHHITLNLDHLAGGALNPHLFCKPLLKTPKDQQALLNLALNAHPKVAFGSDSAPHLIAHKHTHACSAGIFSAPLLLSALCSLFEEHKALDKLQSFISQNAMRIYALKEIPHKTITLIKKPPNPPKLPDGLYMPQIFPLNWSIDAICSHLL
ncbi:dihydroorotase [Helicobacter suis]|uniref:dihydroorotase n=1 Tax=Helicobacter suis TaxID=104628 RepID=UPI0013CF9D6C|nr:dihydroorotase [Helicobacter suis]